MFLPRSDPHPYRQDGDAGLDLLVLIGVTLTGDGLDMHIPKGYIYFAMAFSVMVEMLNMRLRRVKPVKLHQTYVEDAE